MWRCPRCRRSAVFPDDRNPWPPGWKCEGCGFEAPSRDDVACLAPEFVDTLTGFDPKLFDTLVQHEGSSFWFVNRARLITFLLKKHFPLARRVLEIGCGTGTVLLALRRAEPQLQLAGTDLHPHGLHFARERLGSDVTLFQMDARNIPAEQAFDVIGAFDVLEHIPEDEKVISEMRDALKPGGGVIIAVPQHPWLWSPTDDQASHQRRYRRGELEAKLGRGGFLVKRSTSFNALLLPLMLASRQLMVWRARRGRPPEALAEFQMAGWMNRLLSSVLRAEVGLTATGMRWPLGGSRFVVAQRR